MIKAYAKGEISDFYHGQSMPRWQRTGLV